MVGLKVRIRQFVNLHVPGGSTLRRGRPADLHLDYNKYADDEDNFYYVEDNKGEREDSREPAAFRFICMLRRVHLEIGIRLSSDFVVDLPKQPLLPEKVSVQNPKPEGRKNKHQDKIWVLHVLFGNQDHRCDNEDYAPAFDPETVTPQTVNNGLDHFQMLDDLFCTIHRFISLYRF